MPAYYTPEQVERLVASNRSYSINFSVKRAMEESVASQTPSSTQEFDIFLSYRNDDMRLALGIYTDLARRGYKIYLDRIMDPHLDRNNVTRATAESLRKRLMQSKSVFYIATDNSEDSKWMPWELGFEDGYRGKSAIVPVTKDTNFVGVEFVKIYSRVQPSTSNNALYIYKPDNTYDAPFEVWRDRGRD